MRYLSLFLLLLYSINTNATSQNVDDALSIFAWEKRQIIVFSPSLDHPQLKQFQSTQATFQEDFAERYLQVWLISPNQVPMLESTPQTKLSAKAFYEQFDVAQDEFRVVLIGYDQYEKLRQSVFNIDILLSVIDQMPMRQDEIRQQQKATVTN